MLTSCRLKVAASVTCRLLLRRRGLQRRLDGSHLDQQSKKLQSSSLLQFWSRRSLIFGSKKAMSTSMATTCRRPAWSGEEHLHRWGRTAEGAS